MGTTSQLLPVELSWRHAMNVDPVVAIAEGEMDVARDMDVASDKKDPVASIGRSMRCRHCGTPLQHTLINLGMSPLCESFLTESELNAPETYYPLTPGDLQFED